MAFIALLMVVATAIAGAAAYFSVYGLAYTFSGVFWSVVVMGASLEAGKLVAASYLYRYWDRTGWILKSYLITGVVALMVLTSTGIFGYLSTGYQQDVLPLKQKQQQVQLLEEEKDRALSRKKQIDDILAGNSSAVTVGADANAARILRETNRGRDNVIRQYRDEQKQVTQRVAQLDKELLELKQDLVKAEAHIGPIMFVAQAFNMGTDDATKWLIFLIIFAFDPMAVALTLAVNIALKLHKEDKAKVSVPPVDPLPVEEPVTVNQPEPEPELSTNLPMLTEAEAAELQAPEQSSVQGELDLQPVDGEREVEVYVKDDAALDSVVEPESVPEREPEDLVVQEQPKTSSSNLTSRAFPDGIWSNPTMNKINELIAHLRYLKEKQAAGETLQDTEMWELRKIEHILHTHGYAKYI